MSSKKYNSWLKRDKFSCFRVENDSIFCNICSKYHNSRLKSEYISIGAYPNHPFSLKQHLKSSTHKHSLLCKFSSENRKLKNFSKKNLRKNEMLKKKKNIYRNSLMIIQNISKQNSISSSSLLLITENNINNDEIKLSEEEKEIIPIIIDKLEIVIFMILSNISNTNFSSLQQLINLISNNTLLQIFNHNSSYSFTGFLEILYNSYKTIITEEIKRFTYFGILVDESLNRNKQNQISILARYLNKDLEITTSFLSVKDLGVDGGKSENVYRIILQVLNEYNLKIENVLTFASDGASNMLGKNKGLLSILNKHSLVVGFHCALHRLNLVMEDSFKNISISELNDCINTYIDISYFINSSSIKRSKFHFFQKQQNVSNKEIQIPILIRWNSNFNALNSVIENFCAVLNLLFEETQQKSEKAQELLNIVCTYTFLKNSSILKSVLKEVNITIKNMQEKNIDIGEFEDLLSKLKQNILHIKEDNKSYGVYLQLMDQYNKWLELKHLPVILIIENPQEEILELTSIFVNIIISNLNNRFPNDITNELINFFNPKNLKDIKKDSDEWNKQERIYGTLVEKFKSIFSFYRFNQKFEDFNIFRKIVLTHIRKFKLKNFKELCLHILKYHQYSNAHTLVRLVHISLLVSPTTSTVESTFSIINDVLDPTRNRMGFHMLNLIMMLKVNLSDKFREKFLKKAAVNWLKEEKKTRRIGDVIRFLYAEGRLSFLPHYKQWIWKEKLNEKKFLENELVNDENLTFSALYKVNEDEKKLETLNSSGFPINNKNKTSITKEEKKKKKKKKKKKDNNNYDEYLKEIKVIENLKNKKKLNEEHK
jgi:hypothetical protein